MKKEALSSNELALMQQIFSRHAGLRDVTLFGSRAKGTHSYNSDIDLSIRGELDLLQAEALASELDELPLPYRFGVVIYAARNA